MSRLERLDSNYWMNSLLEDWQRVVGNTSTVNTATSQSLYTADRIKTVSSGPTIKNYSVLRDSLIIPTATEAIFPYSHRFNCLTAIPSFNTADIVLPVRHHIEGIFYKDLHNKVIGFGFWVYLTAPAATFPVTMSLALKNDASNRSYVTTFEVTTQSQWQHIYIPVQTDTGGTWLFDNSTGIAITIGGTTGGTYQAPTLNSWISGEYYSASGAFNIMSNTGNILRTAGYRAIRLNALIDEIDETTHPRMGRDAADENRLNKRYCEKSYGREVVPATATTLGSIPGGYTAAASYASIYMPFSVEKRIQPAAYVYDEAGNGGLLLSGGRVTARSGGGWAPTNNQAVSFSDIGTTGISIAITNGVGTGQIMRGHYLADADF